MNIILCYKYNTFILTLIFILIFIHIQKKIKIKVIQILIKYSNNIITLNF